MLVQELAEGAFRAAVAVDIREVEEGDAGFERSKDGVAGGEQISPGVARGGDAPAAVSDAAGLEGAAAERDFLHGGGG